MDLKKRYIFRRAGISLGSVSRANQVICDALIKKNIRWSTPPFFEVSKGILIPRAKGGKPVYPFHTMEIGDSFIFSSEKTRFALRKACSKYNNWKKWNPVDGPIRENIFFTARIVDEGIRIWRIK